MRTDETHNRPSGSAASATVLMALVAMAAAISAAPTANAAQIQCAAAMIEQAPVRSVAAAVAAAARDLIGSDRQGAVAGETVVGIGGVTATPPRRLQPRSEPLLNRRPLRESLLNIPPPAL